ncbi:MAG: hypothetical protein U5L45_25255 [Saprospiraceae bacterium]|nr:hypothetical protein [Saprospiraceae bacterium]
MKLRLENNSLRLRVRKSDLQKLQQDGSVIETLSFPNAAIFQYALTTNAVDAAIVATFSDNKIVVNVPLSMATDWVNSDEVGLETRLESGLSILVEKDFPCKDRPWEDTKDTFFELVSEEAAIC